MRNMSFTIKLLALLVLFLLLCIGAYFYFYSDIRTINNHIAALQSDLSFKGERDLHLQAVRKTLADSENDRVQAAHFLIGPEAVVDFIKTVEGLGKVSGVKIRTTGVAIEPAASSSDYYENLSLELETDGLWRQSLEFLSLAESLPYNITFRSVDFSLVGKLPEKAPEVRSWHGSYRLSVIKQK